MDDKLVTELTELNETPANGDLLHIVDVSDTTDDASGTSKKVTRANLVGGLATSANPTFTGTAILPTALTGVLRADSGVVSTDSNVTDIVDAASTSAAGKIEVATVAETTTGTDATRAVSPDGLAGSVYGKRVVYLKNVIVEA